MLRFAGCRTIVGSLNIRTPRGHLSGTDVVSFGDVVAEVQFMLRTTNDRDEESFWAIVNPFRSAGDKRWFAETEQPALVAVSLLSSPLCVCIVHGMLLV